MIYINLEIAGTVIMGVWLIIIIILIIIIKVVESLLKRKENRKIVKEKMKELKLTLKDINEFVPFDEWRVKK